MTNPAHRGLNPHSLARPPVRTGAVAGLLAAAAAMGIAQLLAGLTTPAASPVLAVGQAVIDATPLGVKDWATSTFGTADKTVLVGGVLVLLFAFAALIGIAAVRRLAFGMAGLAVFAAIGLSAVLTRPDSAVSWIWPTLFGAAAGAVALAMLARAAVAMARSQAASRSPATPGGPAGPAATGSAWVSGSPAATEDDRVPASAVPTNDRPTDDRQPDDRPPDDRQPDDRQPDDRPRAWVPPAKPAPGWRESRRAFLTTAGVTLAVAAVGEVGGRQLATRRTVGTARAALRLPRAARPAPPLPAGINPDVPGISPFVTPNGSFYRIDTALFPPQVDPAGWSLRIHGMVRREIRLSFTDLLRRPLQEDWVTLCCVSNPVAGPYIGNAKWLGASLPALLREAGPLAGADQLLSTSADGFTCGSPLPVVMDSGRDSLLAVGMNGAALPVEHGFPARLVVPGLYGYVSACKWVMDIEVTTFAKAQGYWVPRGWSQLGPIKTESRIDVPSAGSDVGPGRVPVAGVAWAQHKGVDAVEVRVDGGQWQQATLAAVPGIDTWRQWTWAWDASGAQPGTHTLEARATDATGYTQTAQVADVAPNGATGYPRVVVTLRSS